ncbi:hypothetical protein FPSE_08973 [Fusarium pseudograminearum CS3096]|uniref:Uncharacterized protein n=1 Tax=Fusarium pseudograminearum (strain CS3096) TaxID=1028729 RepID=K3UGB4_FUSPC|nr:hypothetical protein FPSE_08973 [Fusarium pseudograminearum CS3096]EKJ70821.1 hypothetical protein FPSE_08973 [Fusarium pseudograminearum CS3096]
MRHTTSIASDNGRKVLRRSALLSSWARAEPSAEAPTYSTPPMSFHGDSHFRFLDIKYQGWVIVEKILARRVSSSHENYLICGPLVSSNMTEDLEAIPESGSSWDSWPDDDFHTQQGQGTLLYSYRD